MLMSARQCQVFAPEVTASTPWDPTSVNVPLATVRVKPATNVKVSQVGNVEKARKCSTVKNNEDEWHYGHKQTGASPN